jgi:putative acetyltransferase
VLAHIVDVARARGYRRLSLETGLGDAFDAAVGLYATHGFVRCGPFAEYEDNGFSQFFSLDLVSDPGRSDSLMEPTG